MSKKIRDFVWQRSLNLPNPATFRAAVSSVLYDPILVGRRTTHRPRVTLRASRHISS